MSKQEAQTFNQILKKVMETERPPEGVDSRSVDWLVQEGYIEEHGNRTFHVTEAGALFYSENYLRLLNNHRT